MRSRNTITIPQPARSAPRSHSSADKPGFPDGSTVDADGFLWNAEFNGGRLIRYARDGHVDRVVPVPLPRPTGCAFGGPGLDTLYVTTTSQGMTSSELEAQPLAGALLALELGVRGLVEPRWAELRPLAAHTMARAGS